MERKRSREGKGRKGEGRGGGMGKQRAARGQQFGLGLVSAPWSSSHCPRKGAPSEWGGGARPQPSLDQDNPGLEHPAPAPRLPNPPGPCCELGYTNNRADFPAMRRMSNGHASSQAAICNLSPANAIPSNHQMDIYDGRFGRYQAGGDCICGMK